MKMIYQNHTLTALTLGTTEIPTEQENGLDPEPVGILGEEKTCYSFWHSKPQPYKAARRHVTSCLTGDKNSNSKFALNIFV
jgi:hypothetical protein